METKQTESRLGRFSYLLKGRAKPRRNHSAIAILSKPGIFIVRIAAQGVVLYGPRGGGQDRPNPARIDRISTIL